jgi:hypothetical protein
MSHSRSVTILALALTGVFAATAVAEAATKKRGVQRRYAGESLWSIARHELGADASSAAIARLVDRIWNLNSERIATGDPDMLMVGTALRLP